MGRVLPDLLRMRSALREERLGIQERMGALSRDSFGPDEEETRRLDREDAAVWAKLETVGLLLRPFEAENDAQLERFNRERCEEIMRL